MAVVRYTVATVSAATVHLYYNLITVMLCYCNFVLTRTVWPTILIYYCIAQNVGGVKLW